MKLLVFTEGTILMHKNAKGKKRKEIVQQIKNNENSVHDFGSYTPIGNSVKKLKKWERQYLKIYYLTSRKNDKEIQEIKKILIKYDFPKGELFYCKDGEEYKDVAERILPDILIEDDCESIGGKSEMTITNVKSEFKAKIKSVVIKEFEGIDGLPDDFSKLLI